MQLAADDLKMHSKAEKEFRDVVLFLRPAHTAYMLVNVTIALKSYMSSKCARDVCLAVTHDIL